MARDRDERDDEDEDEDDRPRRRSRDEGDEPLPPQTRCPGTSKAAAILLIIIGALAALVSALGVVSLLLGGAGERGSGLPSICGLLLWVIIALYGLMAGIRTLTGNSTEPIFNGVIGILFSLIFLGIGGLLVVAGAGAFGGGFGGALSGIILIVAGLFLIYGLLLAVAGILLLVGRNKYIAWRKYRKEQRQAARGYDEDDDRPRKRRRRDDDDEDDRRHDGD